MKKRTNGWHLHAQDQSVTGVVRAGTFHGCHDAGRLNSWVMPLFPSVGDFWQFRICAVQLAQQLCRIPRVVF